MSLSMLPSSRDMEMAVLSAVLQEPRAAMPVAQAHLTEAHFYHEDNRLIWSAAVHVAHRGQPPDAVAVLAELRMLGTLEAAGGEGYLEECANAAPGASAVEPHCEILHAMKLRRDFIGDMTERVREAYDAKQEMPTVMDKAEQCLTRIVLAAEKSEVATGADAIREFITEGFEHVPGDGESPSLWYRIWGMPCGLKHLDRILHGFRRGSVTLIMAPPNVGKTMLMLNMADWFATHENPVLFYSLEQPRGEIGQRLVAIRSQVQDDALYHELQKEKGISPEAMALVEKAAKDIEGMPLYVDDSAGGLTLRRFKSETRKMVRKHGIRVVMVDYAQLMDVESMHEDRHDLKVGAIARGMKMLARELNIHVVVASQLSRDGVKNAGGEPRIGHAKESGALEEVADYILGLWNPTLKKADENDTNKIAEAARTINIRVLKHRHGGGKGQRADVMMLPGRCKMVALTKEHFEMNLEDEPDGEVNLDGVGSY